MTTTVMPSPGAVAERALDILAAVEADPEYTRLREGCAQYSSDWTTFTGYAVVDGYSVDRDARPLFPEALRAMALKAAVYEMTGDETAAELAVPVAVDEMIHALAAQFTVLSRVQERTGVRFVHATDREDIGGWDEDDYTHQAYRAAWGEPPSRYWIGRAETARRRAILSEKYAPLGIAGGGRAFPAGFALS